jgi:uncharacterized protein (UPF0305 family)
MSLIPNVPPESFTLSAIVIGYLLIDDTTANEQNALGNWLMLTAQVLCTNAYFLQVQNERNNNIEKFGKSFTNVGTNNNVRRSNINNNQNYNDPNYTIEMLEKMRNSIDKEIENLKKEII